jgi:hypothetical protein
MESGFWSLTMGVAYIVGFALATWLLMTLTAPLGEERGLATPFLIALLGGVSAGVLFYGAKSASLAQLSGTLGAVVGVGVPLAFLRGFTIGRGAVALAILLFMSLWTTALGFCATDAGAARRAVPARANPCAAPVARDAAIVACCAVRPAAGNRAGGRWGSSRDDLQRVHGAKRRHLQLLNENHCESLRTSGHTGILQGV